MKVNIIKMVVVGVVGLETQCKNARMGSTWEPHNWLIISSSNSYTYSSIVYQPIMWIFFCCNVLYSHKLIFIICAYMSFHYIVTHHNVYLPINLITLTNSCRRLLCISPTLFNCIFTTSNQFHVTITLLWNCSPPNYPTIICHMCQTFIYIHKRCKTIKCLQSVL